MFDGIVRRVSAGRDDIVHLVSSGSNELAQRISNAPVDGIPLASQSKSLVQAISGDKDGAQRTQDNFTKRCLGVSQLRSAIERRNGNEAAAEATRAEFDRCYHEVDERAKQALAPIASLAGGIVEASEKTMRPMMEAVGQRASVAASLGVHVVEQGTTALNGVASSLAEHDWGNRFGELLAQHRRSRHDRSSSSASCGARVRFQGGIVGSLDEYTILTYADGPQCGEQCCCCLEEKRRGEEIRVLPCFHTLHSKCATQWLIKQAICPVCRCDIVASLEARGS